MASFETLAVTVRTFFRALRYAGFVFIGLAAWFVGREVWDLYTWFAGIHVAAGVVFLMVFGAAFYLLILRPAMRYLRVPAAVRPPDLPALSDDEALGAKHLVARARGISCYLAHQTKNPALADSRAEVEAVLAACRKLETSLGRDVDAGRNRLIQFERDEVDPLLEPLDEKAREIIRNEAMAVAAATALSPSGAADAFFVLWRNANLVAKLAQLYYGRPGVGGTFLVLRDVSFAVFVASQLQGVASASVETASGFLGKAASPIAGPVADGAINGLVSLRIGYVAMRRCRAFRAFTEKSVASFLSTAFREAGKQSAGLASDLVTKVGVPLLKMPVDASRKLIDWAADSVRGWFSWKDDEPEGSFS